MGVLQCLFALVNRVAGENLLAPSRRLGVSWVASGMLGLPGVLVLFGFRWAGRLTRCVISRSGLGGGVTDRHAPIVGQLRAP